MPSMMFKKSLLLLSSAVIVLLATGLPALGAVKKAVKKPVAHKVVVKIKSDSVQPKKMSNGFPKLNPDQSFQTGLVGSVTAIQGTILTVQGIDNSVYRIAASGAEVINSKGPIAISDIRVGDPIVAHGTMVVKTMTAAKIINKPEHLSGTQPKSNPLIAPKTKKKAASKKTK